MSSVLEYAVAETPGEPRLQLVTESVPFDVSLDALGSQIVSLAGRLSSATCRWLLLVARFDEREGCAVFGLPSTASWLSHACGLSHRTAVEHVRVARALVAQPRLVEEMDAGRLSYSQTRAISRVAKEGEHELVDDLVMAAEHASVRQLETLVRGLRTVEANTEVKPIVAYAGWGWGADSCWKLNARLAPEQGALVQTALERIAATADLSHVDALTRMAEIALAALADDGISPRELRGDERAAVVIHLDADRVPQLQTPQTEQAAQTDVPVQVPTPAAHLAHGPGLADAVVLRLLCEGRIRTILESRSQPGTPSVLDVGRSRRVVSERQYRALLLREHGTCAFPGCDSHRRLEAHHVEHWLHGGLTNMANLLLLCQHHHHSHHDGEFTITPINTFVGRGTTPFEFHRADGQPMKVDHESPERGNVANRPRLEDEHDQVTATAATTRWDGQRMDHDYAVLCLATSRERARR